MTHRRISVLQWILVVALTAICSPRCTNAAEHDEGDAGFIIDPASAADDAASRHSSLRKRDLGLGNGVEPNGLGSIFGNQGQGPPQDDVPARRRGPPMTKAEREAAVEVRKQQIQAAIAAMKASKIHNLGRVQPTQDELKQIAAPTPAGEPKLLGYSRTITDAVTLFDPDAGTVTKCVTSEVDGGIRLLLSGESSTTVHVFNPDLPDEAHIFTITANPNNDSWTNTVRTEVGNRVCLQAANNDGNSHFPTIQTAAYVILGGTADRRRKLTHEPNHCNYNAECIEPAGTPANPGCGVHAHSTAVDDARMGVAAMIFQKYNSDGVLVTTGCTGSLINGDVPDLFLTAHHCVNTDFSAASTELFFFEYEECGACNGQWRYGFLNSDSSTHQPSQVGTSIMATYSPTDATLLRLHGVPPAGSVSLGYSTAPGIADKHGEPLYRISHPALGHQAYSEHLVDTNRVTCGADYDRTYFISSSDTYGATEGGSSGSPVVNAAGHIVGQLFGACGYSPRNTCNTFADMGMTTPSGVLSDYDDATVDGALSVSYANAFHPWLSQPYTCKAAGERGCGPNTPCCSGIGNCSSHWNYQRRKCLPWEYQSSTPTPTCTDGVQNGDETGVDCGGSCPDCEPSGGGGTCTASGSPALNDNCSDCCSETCHRRKIGQCK